MLFNLFTIIFLNRYNLFLFLRIILFLMSLFLIIEIISKSLQLFLDATFTIPFTRKRSNINKEERGMYNKENIEKCIEKIICLSSEYI